MSPLLLDLSEQLSIPLEFYSYPPPNPPSSDMLMSVFGGKTWATKFRDGMQKYTLKQWLETPAYFVDSTRDYRTREQVLKHISNKEGGAHYDDKIVAIVDCLRRFSKGNDKHHIDGVQMFLLDVSALIYWLGTRMCYSWDCRQKSISKVTDPKIIKLDAEFEAVRI